MQFLNTDVLKIDGTYKDAKREQNFLQEEWGSYSKRIRIAAILTGLAYLSGLHSDYVHLSEPGFFNIMLTARIITFIMAALCFLITFHEKGIFHTQKAIFAYFIAISSSECIELFFRPVLGAQQIPFLLFIMIGYFLFFHGKFIYVLVSGLLGTVGYSVVLTVVVKEPLHNASPVIVTFLLTNAFSLYLTRFMNKANRTEMLALHELQDMNQHLQEEIVERRKAEEKLILMATTDELTRVNNRRHFTELARREVQRTVRTERPLSLLFLDVDHFKSINDTYGHDAGDEVLKKLALTCVKNIRSLDVFGRFGGEEFAVLLPEVGKHHASQMADRLRILLSGLSIQSGEAELKITVSIGVSTYCEKVSESLEQLIKNADTALYKAKENGRNQVVICDKCN